MKMFNQLMALLSRVVPSRVILENCIELIQREQVGLVKYGVSLSDAPLTMRQTLQHLLEEQLDSANYTRKCLLILQEQEQEYALLRRTMEQALADAAYLQAPDDGYYFGKQHEAHLLRDRVIEHMQRALFRFDTSAVLRQAARTK